MPRRLRQSKARTASWHLLSRLTVGPVGMTDRDAYGQYREQVLAHAPQAGRRPESWWHFEPFIPADLRDGDAPGSLEEFEPLERARLAWLAGTDRLDVDEIAEIERGERICTTRYAHGSSLRPMSTSGEPGNAAGRWITELKHR